MNKYTNLLFQGQKEERRRALFIPRRAPDWIFLSFLTYSPLNTQIKADILLPGVNCRNSE